MLTIRVADARDADAVASVHVRSWQSAYRGMVPDEFLDAIEPADWAQRFRRTAAAGRPTLIAMDDPIPVGFASFGPDRQDANFMEIYALYIHPDFQRRGAGRALLDTALSMVVSGEVRLWCAAQNMAARGFYERYGFVADGGQGGYEIGGVLLPTVRYAITVPRR